MIMIKSKIIRSISRDEDDDGEDDGDDYGDDYVSDDDYDCDMIFIKSNMNASKYGIVASNSLITALSIN